MNHNRYLTDVCGITLTSKLILKNITGERVDHGDTMISVE